MSGLVDTVTQALQAVEVNDVNGGIEDVKVINIESHIADDIYFTDESFKM